MSARVSLQQRIDDYLAERRRLGFELRSWDTFLAGFAGYVVDRKHRGPLTADLMIEWARQDKWLRISVDGEHPFRFNVNTDFG